MPEITRHVALASYTSLGVGGEAEYFAVATTKEEVSELIAYAQRENPSVTILGGGSNTLINDQGITGLVILNKIERCEITPNESGALVHAGSGTWFDDVVKKTTEAGYWGLENLSGIPGTAGGGVVQNINAYGVTLADMVRSVEAINLFSGERKMFDQESCQFAYRNSIFRQTIPKNEWCITSVTLEVSTDPVANTSYRSASQSIAKVIEGQGITEVKPNDVREAVLNVRKNIGMLWGMHASAGSFFKNPIVSKEAFAEVEAKIKTYFVEKDAALSPWHWPVGEEEKISAAFLMECTPYNKTDFKDQRFNDTVGISPQHTLSIVNAGDATASDITEFVRKISDTIEAEFGVTLEPEVCFL